MLMIANGHPMFGTRLKQQEYTDVGLVAETEHNPRLGHPLSC